MNSAAGNDRDLRSLIESACDTLRAAGIEDPAADAELIAAHVLGETRGRVQALAIMGRELAADEADRVRELVGERASRIPLQHLTGRAPFRSIELSVGPGVFVPRPETETVVQFAIDALRLVPSPRPIAVDLCTGSGAIALSMAHEVPTAQVIAVEKSVEAHAWAARNTAQWGDGRVDLILSDIAAVDPGVAGSGATETGPTETSPLQQACASVRGRVDVLISNPPYVPDEMIPRDPEVRDHDPHIALFGGADGLDLIRRISRIGRQLVASGGLLVLEHAESQGAEIRALLERDGWRASATHPDLTGRDRTTTAVAP